MTETEDDLIRKITDLEEQIARVEGLLRSNWRVVRDAADFALDSEHGLPGDISALTRSAQDIDRLAIRHAELADVRARQVRRLGELRLRAAKGGETA